MGEGFEFALHSSAIEISEKLRLSGENVIANCINTMYHYICLMYSNLFFFAGASKEECRRFVGIVFDFESNQSVIKNGMRCSFET
jgi:hypothetical protein